MSICPARPMRASRRAFTLVELLVVIAIIGVLVGLTIPAIQYAREQANKATCKNNIKQIYLANQQFVGLHNAFPSGGWGSGWVGDPKMPAGKRQPGGYFYSLLPFLERQGLYEHSKAETDPALRSALQAEMLGEWIPSFTCPSRRRPEAYAVAPKAGWPAQWLVNADNPPNQLEAWYRSDYSVNGGTQSQLPVPFIELYLTSGGNQTAGYGPASYNDAEAILKTPTPQQRQALKRFELTNGIAHQFSEITTQDIFDGASNTYLAGEKFLNSAHYDDGVDSRDDHPAYGADVRDLFSFGDQPPLRDQKDLNASSSPLIFGSIHDGTFHVVMCDGAVVETSYDIDPTVHAKNANRRDSRP